MGRARGPFPGERRLRARAGRSATSRSAAAALTLGRGRESFWGLDSRSGDREVVVKVRVRSSRLSVDGSGGPREKLLGGWRSMDVACRSAEPSFPRGRRGGCLARLARTFETLPGLPAPSRFRARAAHFSIACRARCRARPSNRSDEGAAESAGGREWSPRSGRGRLRVCGSIAPKRGFAATAGAVDPRRARGAWRAHGGPASVPRVGNRACPRALGRRCERRRV